MVSHNPDVFASGEPVQCSDCGWKGKKSELHFTYEFRQDPEDEHITDVIPVTECPKCNSSDVQLILAGEK